VLEATKAPDLTPNPLPTEAEIDNDAAVAQLWLAQVMRNPGDPRRGKAEQLLTEISRRGPTRFEAVAALALRTATDPLSVPLAEIKEAYSDLWALTFDFSEDVGTYRSPLQFNKPTGLMDVIEMTTAWYRISTETVTAASTRELARLAHVDTEVMEQQLRRDGIGFQPYGISLCEMEDMTAGEQLFWYDQCFAFTLNNVVDWLKKFPGFTAPVPFDPAASVG
tara:strand:- start:1984 stop:2649 length:666 start_codon:yes stop_codon:yes gene_type:complete